MKKLKLDLDTLAVDSFQVVGSGSGHRDSHPEGSELTTCLNDCRHGGGHILAFESEPTLRCDLTDGPVTCGLSDCTCGR